MRRGHEPGKNSNRHVRTIRKFGSFPSFRRWYRCCVPRVPLYHRPATPAQKPLLKGRIRGRNKSATFGYEKTSDGCRDNRPVSRLGMRPPRSRSPFLFYFCLSSLSVPRVADTTFEKPSSGPDIESVRRRPRIEYAFDFRSRSNLDPSTFQNLKRRDVCVLSFFSLCVHLIRVTMETIKCRTNYNRDAFWCLNGKDIYERYVESEYIQSLWETIWLSVVSVVEV